MWAEGYRNHPGGGHQVCLLVLWGKSHSFSDNWLRHLSVLCAQDPEIHQLHSLTLNGFKVNGRLSHVLLFATP